MSDQRIDVRTPLAVSEDVRVEIGGDGTLHVLLPALTLHLDQAHCEQLATTAARARAFAQTARAARTPGALARGAAPDCRQGS